MMMMNEMMTASNNDNVFQHPHDSHPSMMTTKSTKNSTTKPTTPTKKANSTNSSRLQARQEADELASEMERVQLSADHDTAEPMQVDDVDAQEEDAEDDGAWQTEDHHRHGSRSRSRSPPAPSKRTAHASPTARRPRHHRVYGTCTWKNQRSGEDCDQEVAGPEQAELMLCNQHYRAHQECQRRRARKEELEQNANFQDMKAQREEFTRAAKEIRDQSIMMGMMAAQARAAARQGAWVEEWHRRGVESTAKVQRESRTVANIRRRSAAILEASRQRQQQARPIAPRPPSA